MFQGWGLRGSGKPQSPPHRSKANIPRGLAGETCPSNFHPSGWLRASALTFHLIPHVGVFAYSSTSLAPCRFVPPWKKKDEEEDTSPRGGGQRKKRAGGDSGHNRISGSEAGSCLRLMDFCITQL